MKTINESKTNVNRPKLSEQSTQDVTVTIQTTQGNWNNAFPKTDKVGQVILAVVAHFGFAPNGKYELTFRGKTLSAERTLVSYEIDNGDALVFTELGTAV